MSKLNTRFAAVTLTAVMVLGSTLGSVSVKLGGKAHEVADRFSEGTTTVGYTQKSIRTCLRELCSTAKNVISIVKDSYDCTDLIRAVEALDKIVSADRPDVSDAYDAYEAVLRELPGALSALEQVNSDAYKLYPGVVKDLQKDIADSTYNTEVREFMREELSFPAGAFAKLLGIQTPEYFE